ncbi:MAG TPA: hypothetical protein VGC36_05170 [Rhizomicrobium sp.]
MRLDDRFQWFLAPALLLFLLSYWLEFPLFPLARAHQTRGRRPHRAVTPALAAAFAGLAAWPLPSQAQAATADQSPPPRNAVAASQPADLAATIAALSDKTTLTADDYARLAGDTIGFVGQSNPPRGAQRNGVIDDALAAIDRGERSNTEAANWPALRQQLEALRNPPPPPEQQQQKQDEQKKQDQQQGENGEQQQNSDQSNGGAGEQKDQSAQAGDKAGQEQPQNDGQSQSGEPKDQASQNGAGGQEQKDHAASDAKSQAAEQKNAEHGDKPQEQKSNQQAASEPQSPGSAGGSSADRHQQPPAGDAARNSEEQKNKDAGAAADSAKQEPKPLDAAGLGDQPGDEKQDDKAPTRMVGGGQAMANDAAAQAEAEAEAQGDLALADALGRMRQVKQGDAPAVLFDRMNRAEGKPRPTTPQQDW